MNPRRKLATAQRDVVEEALNWHHDRDHDLAGAVDRYEQARLDFDAPGAASGRPTSIAAAHTNLPAKRSVRRQVIEAAVARWRLYDTGVTCSELEAVLRKRHETVSSAVNWAETAGWLYDSGETRPTQFGRAAIVYRPSDEAIRRSQEDGEASAS